MSSTTFGNRMGTVCFVAVCCATWPWIGSNVVTVALYTAEFRVKIETRNGAELRATSLAGTIPRLTRLPFLGSSHSPFVRGLSHLVAGAPKIGKTTLLTQLAGEWGETSTILYLTEEGEELWADRLGSLPDWGWPGLTLGFAFGAGRIACLEAIRNTASEIVIIDTYRLLGVEDENDNSQINRAVTPIMLACRPNKTLIIGHHLRKGGGSRGEGIAGGHALYGLVDMAIELGPTRVEGARRVRGWGRLAVQSATIMLDEDGVLVLQKGADAPKLPSLPTRVLSALSPTWQTGREIVVGLGQPVPSTRQLQYALDQLVTEAKAERDPRIPQRGSVVRWRLMAAKD